MANSKLKWFRLDVIMEDKFELIRSEFGSDGFEVIVRLWQKIYGTGYYLEWNEDVALLFAGKLGMGCNVVSEIVKCALRRGLFDKSMYEQYGILTSHGIQKWYFECIKRQKEIEVAEAYLMVDVRKIAPNASIINENVNILTENASKTGKNACYKTREDKRREVNTQTRTREENESDLNEDFSSSGKELILYPRISEIAKKHAPTIWKRTEDRISQNGTALVGRIEGIVESAGFIQTEQDLTDLLAHAEKTCYAKPAYEACDVYWVINNHRKVKTAKEDVIESFAPKQADKPKGGYTPDYSEYNARFKV